MLLTIDCGNTQLFIGLFDGDMLRRSWRISTDARRTEDEYFVLLSRLLHEDGVDIATLLGVAIGSVVPAVSLALRRMAQKYLRCPLCLVDHTTNTGIVICGDNPAEVGADRIINAVAGHAAYHGALIIIDFGTATTFDCITAKGEYLGGAICPGVDISQQALFAKAARLANVELYCPPHVIGTNTADCLRSGLLWGYGGQVDMLVRRMKQELNCPVTVIATGGLAAFISEFSDEIDTVDNELTLNGLRLIWQMNN